MISSKTVAFGLIFLAIFYILGLLLRRYLLKEGMVNLEKLKESSNYTNLLSQNQNLMVNYNDQSVAIKYDSNKQKACVFKDDEIKGCLKYYPFEMKICVLDNNEKIQECIQFDAVNKQVCSINPNGRKRDCIKYIPHKIPQTVEEVVAKNKTIEKPKKNPTNIEEVVAKNKTIEKPKKKSNKSSK